MAVQINPIKPTLKAPGTERLIPKYDTPLSRVAFKFNLRRFILEALLPLIAAAAAAAEGGAGGAEAGAYPRPLFGST
jgi:hypothetical protein